MAYGHIKDFNRRTAVDKILRDKAFNIAKNPKCDGYQLDLLQCSMIYNLFDKKASGGQLKIQLFLKKN